MLLIQNLITFAVMEKGNKRMILRRIDMTNVEHLLENGLIAVDEACSANKDCYLAFIHEMGNCYNKTMLNEVNLTKDELWQVVQYIKFVRETNV